MFFCDSIIDVINKASDCPLFDREPLLWLDNIKYKMTKFAVNYAIQKRKLYTEKYYFLQNALKREHTKLASNKQQDLKEIETSKCKIKSTVAF